MSTVKTLIEVHYRLPEAGELCDTDMTRFVYAWSYCGKEGVGHVDCFNKEDFLKLLKYLNKCNRSAHYIEMPEAETAT